MDSPVSKDIPLKDITHKQVHIPLRPPPQLMLTSQTLLDVIPHLLPITLQTVAIVFDGVSAQAKDLHLRSESECK